MVQEIKHTYPSQLAVRAIAHTARTATPPSLLERSIMVSHILRSYLRVEYDHNGMDRSDMTLAQAGDILGRWRGVPLGTTFYGAQRTGAENFLYECREYFKNAYRLAARDGREDSANVAGLGLTFIYTMAAEDYRAQELLNKASIYYPVYETNPFIALGVAREVLRDVETESYYKTGRNFAQHVQFDPLTNIELFYQQTMHLPHHLTPRTAPSEKTDDAVRHLADLADKLEKFTGKNFNHRTNGPGDAFRDNEGVGLKVLTNYLAPYLQGRTATIQAQRMEPRAQESTLLDFCGYRPRRRHRDGIIRNLPVVVPEPGSNPQP